MGYFKDKKENDIAIGIDIPSIFDRKNGKGTKTIKLYLDYLKSKGYKRVFTQTQSANIPMIKCAEKIGFKELYIEKNYREVNCNKYDAVTFVINL